MFVFLLFESTSKNKPTWQPQRSLRNFQPKQRTRSTLSIWTDIMRRFRPGTLHLAVSHRCAATWLVVLLFCFMFPYVSFTCFAWRCCFDFLQRFRCCFLRFPQINPRNGETFKVYEEMCLGRWSGRNGLYKHDERKIRFRSEDTATKIIEKANMAFQDWIGCNMQIKFIQTLAESKPANLGR